MSSVQFYSAIRVNLNISYSTLTGLLFVFTFFFSNLFSQQIDPTQINIIEQRIEIIAEALEEEDIDFSTLFDELSYYYEHSLNLNKATREDLQQLYLLNDIQINNLLTHIEKHGKLIAIYELQTVEGFDRETIQRILPFVKVASDINSPRISFKEMLKGGESELFVRYIRVLEEMEGFSPIEDSLLSANPNKRYLGDPSKIYTRYRFKFSNNVSWGMTAEKDAGEEFLEGSQANGFDFYSAHLYLRNIGKLKHFALGDYQMQLGQGLTLWSGNGLGKSSEVMNIKKSAAFVKPYTSVDENAFMRGMATSVEFQPFTITGFYSNKHIDANITYMDSLSEEITVSSFQSTGFHRTFAELEDKHAIREVLYGGNVSFRNKQLQLGVSAIQSDWKGQVVRDLKTYNQFEWNSNSNLNLGFDYSYVKNNFNLFGELARSNNGGLAYLNGALISLSSRLAMSVLSRSYQRNFQSLSTNAFSENTKSSNEKGTFLGLEAVPFKHFTFIAYYDQFQFPWMKYLVDAPSVGYEYLTQLRYQPSKNLEMYVNYRKEVKAKNAREDVDKMDYPVDAIKQNLRLNATYKISESFSLRNRFELVQYEHLHQREQGYLIYQDVMYKALNSPVAFSFRYALFDTDSYDSRIYAYENDVLYYFSIPSYYYRGSRFYLTFNYKVNSHISLWVRYAQSYYANRDELVSGLNTIEANTKSELKAQLRVRW